MSPRYAEPRKLITWNTPILRLVKALAGVLKYKLGIVGQKALWQAVSDRLPDVSVKILETRYTLDDVVKEVKEKQNRELILNCLYGRADMVYREGREEKDPEFLAVVESLVLGSGFEVSLSSTPVQETEYVHTTSRDFSTKMGERIFKRDKNRCMYCLCPLGLGMNPGVIDHLVSWAGHGESVEWNGVAACARCNNEKSDMHPIEYMRFRFMREKLGRQVPKIDQ